jgi:hypothetical protein
MNTTTAYPSITSRFAPARLALDETDLAHPARPLDVRIALTLDTHGGRVVAMSDRISDVATYDTYLD